MEIGTNYLGFEVLTAVVMKGTIFWDVTPFSPLSANRRFGGTYRLHLKGRKISRARNQRESTCHPEDGGDMFFQNGLQRTIRRMSQKMILFRD
jgi:hypothetical protein